MKKKLLLSIVFVISGIILVNAQCTPDNTCNKLVCPDTITNLPTAHVSVLYSTFLTVRVPTDTTISSNAIHVDSINYTSVTGLPTGFTANPNNVRWLGGTKGCIQISGTPDDSMQGKTYKLIINTMFHGKIGTTIPFSYPIVLNGYKIFVNDTTVGINEINAQNGSFFYNHTNCR